MRHKLKLRQGFPSGGRKPPSVFSESSRVCCIPTKVCRIPTKVCCIPSKVCRIPSKVFRIPSKVFRIPSTVFHIPTKVCRIPTKVCRIPSKVFRIPTKVFRIPTKVYEGLALKSVSLPSKMAVCEAFMPIVVFCSLRPLGGEAPLLVEESRVHDLAGELVIRRHGRVYDGPVGQLRRLQGVRPARAGAAEG